MGCAVRLSADAGWDCCSVNKTVRGCSAVVYAKDTDSTNALKKNNNNNNDVSSCFYSFQQFFLLQFKSSRPKILMRAY